MQNNISEFQRNNWVAMIAHGIDVLLMSILCIIQVIDGSKKPIFAVIAVIIGFAPVVGEVVCWCRNKETTMIKHFVGYGYAVFFTFFIFTSINNLSFMFVVPMVLIIAVYNDFVYSLKIDIGIVIECIVVVILGAKTGKFGYIDLNTAILQVVVIILIGVYSLLTSKVLNVNNDNKIKNIKEAQQKAEEVLNNISKVSEQTKKGIEEINIQLNKLSEASNFTKDAMEQVTSGIDDTVEAVQSQISQTEEIQSKVDEINNVATSIMDKMQHTLDVLDNGKKDVELLVEQVDVSVRNGTGVANKLTQLDEYIVEMNSIVELISGIASQTSLLALNASIEAARAGESGKGFAVVASEISSMATQTKNATGNITQLILDISSSIEDVVKVIRNMIDGINKEKQSTEDTASSFADIQENTIMVQDSIENLVIDIRELKEANKVIVESTQKISKVSENVATNAGDTMELEEKNVNILDDISNIMENLLQLTGE